MYLVTDFKTPDPKHREFSGDGPIASIKFQSEDTHIQIAKTLEEIVTQHKSCQSFHRKSLYGSLYFTVDFL